MSFNIFCKIAEKNPQMPQLAWLLRQAKLFVIDQPVQEFLAGPAPDPAWYDWVENTFTMPFPVVVVIDMISMVVLYDIEDAPVGVKPLRGFMEIIYTKEPYESFDDRNFPFPKWEREYADFSKDNHLIMITRGVLSDLIYDKATGKYKSWASIHSTYGTSSKNKFKLYEVPMPKDKPEVRIKVGEILGRNPAIAWHELIKCSEPTNFIMETAPKKAKNPSKSKKIPREHERPKFTLLEPAKIRKVMGTPLPGNGTVGSPKRPHDRRAHTRTLRSSRFGDNQGKQVSVKAAWIGPSEATVGNKIYKVRLDL